MFDTEASAFALLLNEVEKETVLSYLKSLKWQIHNRPESNH